jgi:D-alanyl-D-alanine carboxypeptidase/D-alanyl-D-alanine-endopeptidase (penicillin-binding protein 4)
MKKGVVNLTGFKQHAQALEVRRPLTALVEKKRSVFILSITAVALCCASLLGPAVSKRWLAFGRIDIFVSPAAAAELPPCLLHSFSSQDALLVAGPDGSTIYSKNADKKSVPASTLKILTGLTAIHHFGKSYQFRTEFYLDQDRNLKVKGYGDPLLVSEVWQEIASALALKLQTFNDLVLDDTYFADDIIPGVGSSTNPYDAPNGALCANFNTVFFKRDKAGRVVSAEPQTPITPLARKKIRQLGLNAGRYTFSHHKHEAARYAGEILMHFLNKNGTVCQGDVRAGPVAHGDALIYTYHSTFTLEEAVKKMLEFSNNFIANQLLLALGAQVHGAPGTLAKGVDVFTSYCREVLGLSNIQIVEGSGISRENRLSPVDMLAVLKRFETHRALLVREGTLFYKTGSLRGIKTRAGYIETCPGGPYYFVVFLNSSHANIDSIVNCVKKSLHHGQNAPN